MRDGDSMTRDEWLSIGYEKLIIEDVPLQESMTFYTVYSRWFKMKMHKIRHDSLDRIEVTFNKYYKNNDICNICVHTIDKLYICRFLNDILVDNSITEKEYGRIYQIVNNVLVYALDNNLGHAPLIDWGYIKRYIYNIDMISNSKEEFMISPSDRKILFDSVLIRNIYPLKYSCCLALLMNFYLGLRIGELASLSFSDFDLTNKCVRITKNLVKYYPRDEEGRRSATMQYIISDDLKTKTAKRVLPLTDECVYLYEKLLQYHHDMNWKSEFICYDGTDVIMSRSLDRTLRRLCQLCGIQHINSHRIRKSYASVLHMSGIPTRVISDLMGHVDMETTEHCYILNYEAGYTPFYGDISQALDTNIKRK